MNLSLYCCRCCVGVRDVWLTEVAAGWVRLHMSRTMIQNQCDGLGAVVMATDAEMTVVVVLTLMATASTRGRAVVHVVMSRALVKADVAVTAR